jgi:hypothetical protein
MTLFHKYYSRKLLFAADLIAALKSAGPNGLSGKRINELALRYGIQNPLCGELLSLLQDAALIEYNDAQRRWQLSSEVKLPSLALSRAEEAYLQRILRLPQASLFLPSALSEKLTEPNAQTEYDAIDALEPIGEPRNPSLSQPEFCCILEAISRGCAISYRFRARDVRTPRRSCAVPWRLEYSAYDNRWWLILYRPEEYRCIKAWLANLSDIALERHITVSEKEILKARKQALMPEPVVLRVENARNALERCFLVLERKQIESSKLHPDGSATISFRYYSYEENELLRQLLFLGSYVQLLAPQSLRAALLKHVNEALKWFK